MISNLVSAFCAGACLVMATNDAMEGRWGLFVFTVFGLVLNTIFALT